jgi:NAD(P)H-dependent FMN reductase
VPLKLQTIICSTRPGRVGAPVAEWFHGVAQQHGKFDAELIDLTAVNLPLFNEPKHPRLKQYEHGHTKAWSAIVERADAFVFVTPEYNYAPPPALLNAIDYLNNEWAYKPLSFVSYGAAAGGARAVQVVRAMAVGVKLVPIFEGVLIPLVATQMKDGKFAANEGQVTAANTALTELYRWADALQVLRQPAK